MVRLRITSDETERNRNRPAGILRQVESVAQALDE